MWIHFCSTLPAVLSAAVSSPPTAGQVSSFTHNGREISVIVTPVNTSHITFAVGTAGGSSLEKRTTVNACQPYGCGSVPCSNTLSTSPDAPLAADCSDLAAAITAYAHSEVGTVYPCNSFGSTLCPNFTVAPGYEHAYTLGTCLVGFVNLFTVGGPSESFCDFLMGGSAPSIFNICVTTGGYLGGYCLVNEPSQQWAIEVRHV